MRILFVFSCVLISSLLSAQISIISGDMPSTGDTVQTATDTLATGLAIGNAGVNQTWDFSTATPHNLNTNYVLSPGSTPDGGSFPSANMAITADQANYAYFNNSASAFTALGLTGDFLGIGLPLVINLSPDYDRYRFPTQYGNSYTDNYGFTQSVPEADLPQALKDEINNQLPAGVTLIQVRVTFTSDVSYNIDGWGTTITPICSYPSLREKKIEQSNINVDAQVSIFGFPSWQDVIDSQTTTTTYSWLAKDTKLELATSVSDAQGNITSLTYSLIPPALSADFTASETSVCPGGSIDFTDLSVGCPDDVSWSFPGGTPSSSTDPNPTNIVYDNPGTYAVTLQVNRGGDSDTETKNAYITVNSPPVADAGPNDSICIGDQGMLIASGGSTYEWNNGFMLPGLFDSPLATTTYSVTVTDGNNCTASDSATIFVRSLPTAEAGGNDTICPSETAMLTASGGSTYTWENGTNTADLNISPAITTTYSVTVSDQFGCSDIDSATVVVNTAPTANAGTNDTICLGEATSLTATGGGSYLWNTGDTTATIIKSPLSTTNYSVTVTASNGCTDSDGATIRINPLPTQNLIDKGICFGSSTNLDAGNAGSGYLWSTGESSKIIVVDSGGDYSVTVTNIYGCITADTATVTVGAALTVVVPDQEICLGDTALLDANTPGSYQWSTGASTSFIEVTQAGDYSVTVSDSVGCSGSDTATVVVNPLPVADAGSNDVICLGDTGKLSASGGVDYEWNNGTVTDSLSASPTSTTVYNVTVTDVNGCKDTDSASIVVNPLPAVDAGSNDTVCNGETALLIGSGGGIYAWSEGTLDDSLAIAPNTTTTFGLTVTDVNGCSAADNATVEVLPVPMADAGANVEGCIGDSATLTATGGDFYQWNNGDTTASTRVALRTTTTYLVRVSNIEGCLATDTVRVTVNPLPDAEISGLAAAYCPNNGEVSVVTSPAGGTLSGDGISGNIFEPSDLSFGGTSTVTYAYTDSNGCMDNDTMIVEVFPESNVFFSLASNYCEGESPVALNGNPVGGTFSGDGVTNGEFDPSVVGIGGPYTVAYAFTDSFGCSYTDTQMTRVDTIPVLSVAGLDSVYCLESGDVTLIGVPAGGTFSGPGVSNGVFNPDSAGVGGHIITYSYSDGNGCEELFKVSVSVRECVGISTLPEQSFNVYPNPVDDVLTIELKSINAEQVTLMLIDMFGKQVYREVILPNSNRLEVPVNELAAGAYWLLLDTEKNRMVKRIVVAN